MSHRESSLSMLDHVALDNSDNQAVAILAVGDSDEWNRRGNRFPPDSSIEIVSIDSVTSDLINSRCPSVVVSPALATRFDCIDLAQILFAVGYQGRYRAVTTQLPDPTMVEREIRQLCPGLDFALLVES